MDEWSAAYSVWLAPVKELLVPLLKY